MQDRWYGDNRDLVKWGTLLELARIYQVKQILQVLYHRPNEWNPIEVDGKLVQIPNEVIQHFRDSKSIVNLKSSVPIEVLGETFADRKRHLQNVIGRVQDQKEIKKIVFLDPDTGIQPAGKASLKHALESELKLIWNSLSREDVLVFYQHQRRIPDWIDTIQNQFASAIGVQNVKRAKAPRIAPDVVFFYAQKE